MITGDLALELEKDFNPPFVGYAYQSQSQKEDILQTTGLSAKNMDYVASWYFKAAQWMQGTGIKAALVSTNSITQGEQVAVIWKPLMQVYGIHINFAHRTFRWDSESNDKAQVHCVIIGFSMSRMQPKYLYSEGHRKEVASINPYLLDAPTIFISSRSKPLCDVPTMTKGNQPTDSGNFIFDNKEYTDFIQKEPLAEKYIHLFLGSREFINNIPRFCLWLVGVSPTDLKKMPLVRKRIEAVKEFRLNSSKEATRRSADTPSLFQEIRQPAEDEHFIAVPEVSSGNRRYVPMGFLDGKTIVSNKLQILTKATLYHFGIMQSNVHNSWMRTVCGRLKSDYDYSVKIVYNNFPWPTPTDKQKVKIEQTAQGILNARKLYPNSSLADLYNESLMPPELRKAHQANDKAVMQAYGFDVKTMTEASCVAELMKMYQKLTQED